MAKTAPEIIAFHLFCDWNEIKDGIYQRHRNPSVYVYNDDYYCCPTAKQKLPSGFSWKAQSAYDGRTVYRALAA